MAMFKDHLTQVLRKLSGARLFTAITLITLAVGAGANTVVFSIVEGVLLKPLNYPHLDQLIGVWHRAPGIGLQEVDMALFVYFIDREQSTTLQDIGTYSGDSLSVTGVGRPEHVQGLDVTDGTLPTLGVTPALGRLFTRQDDSPGAPETVLLSYGYWRQKWGFGSAFGIASPKSHEADPLGATARPGLLLEPMSFAQLVIKLGSSRRTRTSSFSIGRGEECDFKVRPYRTMRTQPERDPAGQPRMAPFKELSR